MDFNAGIVIQGALRQGRYADDFNKNGCALKRDENS